LNLSPTTAYAGDAFWSNQTNAMIALAGVYRGQIPINNTNSPDMSDIWSYSGMAYFDLCTDNGYDRRGNNTGQSNIMNLTNGLLTADNAVVGNIWTSSYFRINAANTFLANIDKVSMDDATKARMIAEVRFLRAAMLFYLTQFYGDVPMPTSVLSIDDANTIAKTSQADVYNFIEQELKDAVNDLPRQKDLTSSEIGRATKQAALGFLGRLYLAKKDWANAISTYQQIIDWGDNIIDPSYTNIFNDVGITSSENIFAILYLPSTFANYLPLQAYPNVSGTLLQGWGLLDPLESLANCYDFNDGTPFSYSSPLYNPDDVEDNRDPRFHATFICNNSTFSGIKIITSPDSSKLASCTNNGNNSNAGYGSRSGYYIRKYFNEGWSSTNLSTGYGGGFPVIRYAEVLLSYLEANIEQNTNLNQQLLDNTINKVRGRASVNMPPIEISALSGNVQDQLRQITRKERRIELAFEGLRWWDIMRWGIADQTLEGDFYGSPFPGSQTTLNLPAGYSPDPYQRWWVCKKAFRVGQDEKWPIPQSEQNINPNLR